MSNGDEVLMVDDVINEELRRLTPRLSDGAASLVHSKAKALVLGRLAEQIAERAEKRFKLMDRET